jgi:hypothetical protein
VHLLLEIIDRIVFNVERDSGQQNTDPSRLSTSELPPYATISKQWKEAIEVLTSYRLRIRRDEHNQPQATVTRHRRKYLRRLSYEVSRQVECKEEEQSNNEAFTQGIKDFFSPLRPWNEVGIHSDL